MHSMKHLSILFATTLLGFLAITRSTSAADVTPAEARAIAKESYIYGVPLVDNYRIQYSYFQNKEDPNYKVPWNQLINIPRVYTPADTAIQTPNSDTPYSFIGMDLRAEPLVLTVPKIEKKRYFTIQLIDAYTHNFAYIGSRTTGNDGGSYLISGPNWRGETPSGIKQLIRSETQFVFAAYRTQLFNPEDMENVKKIQAGYKVQPLSAFLGQPAPKAAPTIDFVKPLTPEAQRTSTEFYNILNFVLRFCPTVPSEKELMARFAKIGVGGDKTFDASKLSPEMQTPIEGGMANALTEFGDLQKNIDEGKVTSGKMFGTRDYLKNNYLYRMGAAVYGIYGNSEEEAMYPLLALDNEGQKPDGSKKYTLRFEPGQLPPVNEFWSMTMYRMSEILLVVYPIDCYILNAPMLPPFKHDADGGLALCIQNESPEKTRSPTGCPHRKAGSWLSCDSIGRKKLRKMEIGPLPRYIE